MHLGVRVLLFVLGYILLIFLILNDEHLGKHAAGSTYKPALCFHAAGPVSSFEEAVGAWGSSVSLPVSADHLHIPGAFCLGRLLVQTLCAVGFRAALSQLLVS